MWYVVEGVSVLANAVGSLQWSMVKKDRWLLLRFLIWETDRLAGQDTFTPKKSVPHKFSLTVLCVGLYTVLVCFEKIKSFEDSDLCKRDLLQVRKFLASGIYSS